MVPGDVRRGPGPVIYDQGPADAPASGRLCDLRPPPRLQLAGVVHAVSGRDRVQQEEGHCLQFPGWTWEGGRQTRCPPGQPHTVWESPLQSFFVFFFLQLHVTCGILIP